MIILVVLLSLLLVGHALLSIWQMLYAWSSEETLAEQTIPKTLLPSKITFSLIMPALEEAEVIGPTLKQLIMTSYPQDKYELLVSVYRGDKETTKAVKRIKKKFPAAPIKIVEYIEEPRNKSQSMNSALTQASGDYVGIFDAEDHVHVNLLSVVNHLILASKRHPIVQTAVHLMNWRSSFFTLHNVAEYFFWSKSRLLWYAHQGIVPLEGKAVFFPKQAIEKIGGWDESCLTEDAKIGIDLARIGYSFVVFSHPEVATLEEAPDTFGAFVRQRTRWIQGYLQILWNGDWRGLVTTHQVLFLSLFLFPLFKVFLYIWFGISVIVVDSLPVGIALLSYAPLSLLVFQLVVGSYGIGEMLWHRNEQKGMVRAIFYYVLTFVLYDLIIAYAAGRAIVRQLLGMESWEKTMHQNLHRQKLSGLGA